MRRIMLLIFCFYAISIAALGQTSVQTLTFPIGAEHSALGETGTAFPAEPSSIFYNPANGVLYMNEHNLRFAGLGGYEKLLPPLKLDDLYHSFGGGSFYIPAIFPDIDFAVSQSVNYLYFGVVDNHGMGDTTQRESYEMVTGTHLSVLYADKLSAGVAFKYFNSVLEEGLSESRGFTMDLGLLYQRKFSLFEKGIVHPRIGFSFMNLGGSAQYSHDQYEFPLPRTLRVGTGMTIGVPDMLWLSGASDVEQDIIKGVDDEYSSAIVHTGIQFGITPLFRFSMGRLDDEDGSRDEIHRGFTAEYNHKRVLRALYGVSGVGNESWFNFSLSYSHVVIDALGSNTVRENQRQNSWSIGFGW